MRIFPVFWIKIAGGVIMIGYALWEYFEISKEEDEIEKKENLKFKEGRARGAWPIFLAALSMLMLLDLAGDATEVLTVVFLAHYQNIFLVFVGCVLALVAASGVETVIGNRLGKFMKVERIKLFSLLIFLVIGTIVITTTVFQL